MKAALMFSALLLTGCAHENVSGERIRLKAANADRLYIEENGTIDVNISTDRNTLRLGGSLVPLIVCSEPESKLCLESEYFSLLIPGDRSRQWKHGGYAFDLLPATTRSPCPSLSLIHVQSDQAGRFFDFYWSDEQGLVAWRVAYAAANEHKENLFVLERLKQQCNQASHDAEGMRHAVTAQ